ARLREQRDRGAVGDGRLPLLVSSRVDLRPLQHHVAAIDLRAQLHLGAVVRRQRRQLDRDRQRQRRRSLARGRLARLLRSRRRRGGRQGVGERRFGRLPAERLAGGLGGRRDQIGGRDDLEVGGRRR